MTADLILRTSCAIWTRDAYPCRRPGVTIATEISRLTCSFRPRRVAQTAISKEYAASPANLAIAQKYPMRAN